MMQMIKVRGTQNEVKPIEFNVDTVYIRDSIIRVNTDDFNGWEYNEQQYKIREYLEKVSKENSDLTIQNSDLMFESAMLQSQLSEVKNENADITLRVAMLEMGGAI